MPFLFFKEQAHNDAKNANLYTKKAKNAKVTTKRYAKVSCVYELKIHENNMIMQSKYSKCNHVLKS